MDVGALASALIGVQIGRVQLAVAAKMLQMNGEAAASAAKLVDAADRNMDSLAITPSGIGQTVDISV